MPAMGKPNGFRIERITTMKLLFILLALLAASAPAMAVEINVSAAVSLKEVITELADNYESRHKDVVIFKNFGGTGNLARQVENGAPADIFIAANSQWMRYVNDRKLMAAPTIVNLARNTLVFAGRSDKKIRSVQDLLTLDRIAIGNPRSVPAGEYAMAAIRKAGLEKGVAKKLVMAKDVRECLLYLEKGEVDGGFVYLTEALQAKQAKILFVVPQNLYAQALYPMGLTMAGSKNQAAINFFAYLRSKEAKEILNRRGFSPS